MAEMTCNAFLREVRDTFGQAQVTYAANAGTTLTGTPWPQPEQYDFKASLSEFWRRVYGMIHD